MRILIVEDDFVSRTVLSRFLAGFGEVETAENGRIGLDKAEAARLDGRPFDLVTLDLMMPELDGHEVLRRLRAAEAGPATGSPTRVLMTTALDDLKNVRTAYANLCDGYLTKPVRRAVLYEQLAALGFALPK